jgi:hypothetical protein
MNDLYLIGNGFDLAHGLKTSYNDFLLWYLENLIGRAETGKFSDELAEVDGSNSRFIFESQGSISKLLLYSKEKNISIKYKHDFFKKIVENYRNYKWVDIEYEYYMALVEIYRDMEKSNVLRSDFHFSRVKPLNDCFDSIKKKLVEYLLTIRINSEIVNVHIDNILRADTGNGATGDEMKLFLYFNYTATMKFYKSQPFFPKSEIIHIHGKLDDPQNPIIFGYGDEMDPFYEKIENLNSNEFLRNIKSFNYFKANNYQRVIRFVESGDFTVKILGHSCGLSDRILLNTLFENENCKNIKIYHYEKSPIENDYFEKTQEISRHFKASKKGEMRLKIVPFNKYSAIPQNPKNN